MEEHGLAPMEGWILLGRTALTAEAGDWAGAHELAQETLAAARRAGDADLELCALSHVGGALVALGRVAEGTALSTRRWPARSAARGARTPSCTRAP